MGNRIVSWGTATALCTVAVLVLALPSTVGASASSREPAGSEADSVVVTLHVALPTNPVEVGSSVSTIATLSNVGRVAATIIQPGDGSRWGWRTPFVGWSLIREGDDAEHPDAWPGPPAGWRCGNVNGLWRDQIVTLYPGQSVTLSSWCNLGVIDEPGEYRAVMYYWNRPDFGPTAIHSYHESVLPHIRASTPLELVSNEVVVRVVERALQAP